MVVSISGCIWIIRPISMLNHNFLPRTKAEIYDITGHKQALGTTCHLPQIKFQVILKENLFC